MAMQADISKSVEFLRKWLPGGPWILTAIHPEQTGIQTATLSHVEEIQSWLQDKSDWNHYFHVNRIKRAVTKKAKKEDVFSLDWLHVDIDPRKGEDIPEEQKRILKLAERPPEGIPAPTVVLFSGGGYQLFWKLKDPIQLDGDIQRAEQAELYNLQLEVEFGADPCHNSDRIMRLPGTVNWPNKKKREMGREPALARVVEWRDANVYDISQFLQAPDPRDEIVSGGRHEIKVSDNVKRFASVDELPASLPNRAKVIIVQGEDPDKPLEGDSSRSEWLFHACCAMVRAEMSDDEIYSVITDPGFEISASVLDKGTRIKAYAMRQIERARDAAIDPNLDELNRKYAVIRNIGGKCRIMVESFDPVMERPKINYQTAADFALAFQNETITGFKKVTDKQGNDSVVPVEIPKAKWFLSHAKRREYEDVGFYPGGEIPGSYNMWRGFAVDAKQGDCSLYLDHVLANVCSGNEAHYEYLLDWMALCCQKPARQGHVAIVLQGGRGTGKGFFANQFGALFGKHYTPQSNPKFIMGSFNSHLQDMLVLFADEAFVANDKRAESILKTLITEPYLTIEAKGVDARMSSNFLHIIMASNDDWVIPAGEDERRFFVLKVGEEHKQDTTYFGQIEAQMKQGGYGALLHHLLGRDLSGFNVRNVPNTRALQEQKNRTAGADPLMDWWYDCLNEGEVVGGRGWPQKVFTDEVVHSYVSHAKVFSHARSERSNRTDVGKFLQKFFAGSADFNKKRRRLKITHRIPVMQYDGEEKNVHQYHYYHMPALSEARERWDKRFNTTDEHWEVTDLTGWTDPDERFGDNPEEEF